MKKQFLAGVVCLSVAFAAFAAQAHTIYMEDNFGDSPFVIPGAEFGELPWAQVAGSTATPSSVGGTAISLDWPSLNGNNDSFMVAANGSSGIPPLAVGQQIVISATYAATTSSVNLQITRNSFDNGAGFFSNTFSFPNTGGATQTVSSPVLTVTGVLAAPDQLFQLVPGGVSVGANVTLDRLWVEIVPEPTSAILAGLGLAAATIRRKR